MQTTIQSLLQVSRKHEVKLFVYQREFYEYQGLNLSNWLFSVPDNIDGITNKRQFIFEQCAALGKDKVLMLDDDLVFARRRKDNPTLFLPATDDDLLEAVNEMEDALDDYPHVGFGHREGGNRRPETQLFNTRMMRALGWNVPWIMKKPYKINDVRLMEDFYMTLKLLTDGEQTCCLNWIVTNQKGSGTAGGCSTYRTAEMQAEAALTLKRHFPDFVEVVTKETKGAWGGGERVDVRIQWKRAAEYGASQRGRATALDN